MRIRDNHGFTMVEVLTVLFIMAVIAAIAIPNFMVWVPSARLKGAARLVYTELQRAKMGAISERRNYVVTFDVSGGLMNIYQDEDSDFYTTGVETAELVKSVNITNEYASIELGYISGTKRNDGSGNSVSSAAAFTGDDPPHVVFTPTGPVKAKQGSSMTAGGGEVYLKPNHEDSDQSMQRSVRVYKLGMIKLSRYNGSTWGE